jgi:nucleotide-binding universal stress UspA family protein
LASKISPIQIGKGSFRTLQTSAALHHEREVVMNAARYLPRGSVNRILVPTDFSADAALALKRAITVAELYGSSICLLHVITPATHAGLAGLVPGALSEMHTACEIAIEDLASSVGEQNLECTCLVREGALDEQVRAVIAESSIDLLVMATKAGTALHGYALGSTAERILRKTVIPVITVGTCRSLRDWAPTGPRHILYATDLSDVSFRSLAYARSVRQRFSAKLTVAHVLPRDAKPERVQNVQDQLQRLTRDDEEVPVLLGTVGPAICSASIRMGVDLVAVGVEKHLALGEFLFGHTLLEIMAGAPCPVLTIRQWK